MAVDSPQSNPSQANQAKPLWIPNQQRIDSANLTHFVSKLKNKYPEIPHAYADLHQWSVDHLEAFWEGIWDFHQVIGEKGQDILVQNSEDIQQAQWFPQAQLNFAENLLAKGQDNDIAIIEHREDGRRRTFTYGELKEQSARLAGFLKASGVTEGDRVAGFVANGAEAVIGMLATARLGAIWSSCSPDFGLQGVLDRFGQIQPKVLLAINGYQYSGKEIDTRPKVTQILESLPSLNKLVLIDNAPLGSDLPWDLNDQRAVSWQEAISSSPIDGFVPVGFNDPLYILYSSGTTGVPKCIVHGVGGTLLQHLKELALHTDVRQDDKVFYYTTCGWMMWNWLASNLALGATIVLFDGSPFHPSPSSLWDIAEQESIRIFGASAKYYAACEKAHLKPGESHHLEALEVILSTGSPLAHESFDYVYRDIKADVCLSSISGGTDIISCFALGCPTLPVYRGELQCPGLAMDVAFCDDSGNPLTAGKGELVCRKPFPSAPIGFWQDENGEKYRNAYYARFPNIWAHGDYGELKLHSASEEVPAQSGVIIHGRSDATLNPGGVRIGTAEIYRQVEKIEDVIEALAIGQHWQDDERIVLFVRLRDDLQLNDALENKIRQTIRKNTTPRHVPAKIIQVRDIPRTISGKIVELAVRKVVHGEEVKNKDALANPEALQYFENLETLKN